MVLALTCFGVSLFLFLYPFVIYPMLLRLLPAKPAPSAQTIPPQRFTLMFSARNEEADLPHLLLGLRALKRMWPELDVMAWDDASTDATSTLLHAESRWLQVRGTGLPVGKCAAIGRLMAATDAEVVIMLDANIRFRPDQILRFRDAFADPSVGAVGSVCNHADNGGSLLGRVYWALEEWTKAAETRTGNTMGCDGGLWAIRRALYPAVSPSEADDFRPSMEAVLHGHRVYTDTGIVIEEQAIPDKRAAHRAWRIACGAWHAHQSIWSRRRAFTTLDLFKYVSHKLIRWFAALWLAFAAVSGLSLAALTGYMGEALGVAGFVVVLGIAGVGPFRGGLRFLAILAATTGGVLHAMRGGRVEQWAPIRAG